MDRPKQPRRVSDILADLHGPDSELPDDVRETIRLGCELEDDDEPGLPLGWEGVEPVT